MKKRLMFLGFVLFAITVTVLLWRNDSAGVATRPVTLRLTGPDGQRYSGSYVADGRTNVLSGVVPTTVTVRVKELTYRFQPEDPREEF